MGEWDVVSEEQALENDDEWGVVEQKPVEVPKGFWSRTGENLSKAWNEATTPIQSKGES